MACFPLASRFGVALFSRPHISHRHSWILLYNFSTGAIHASSAFGSLCVLLLGLMSSLTLFLSRCATGPALRLRLLYIIRRISQHQTQDKPLRSRLSIHMHSTLCRLGHKHKHIRYINLSSPHRSLTSLDRHLSLLHFLTLPLQFHRLTRKIQPRNYLHTSFLRRALLRYFPNRIVDIVCYQTISNVNRSDWMIGEK